MILQLMTLFVLTKVVVSQKPSPCPETFSYEPRGSENDRWYGNVALRTSDDLNGIWLHINLDRPAELLGNWFGESSTTDNMEFVIKSSRYKLEAGPPVSVRFFVKYNAAKTIPSVKSIRLNGKTICTQDNENELGPGTPTLHISQVKPTSSTNSNENSRPSSSNNGGSRPPSGGNSKPSRPSINNNNNGGNRPSTNRPGNRPSGNSDSNEDNHSNSGSSNRPGSNSNTGSGLIIFQGSDSDSDLDFFPGDFANINRPTHNRPSVKPSQGNDRSPTCGVVASRASPLIAHGQDTSPGEWPWHAALYHSKGIQLLYTCGATLITQQHILTAAHCVTKPQTDTPIDKGNILIYLGKYNLVTFGPEVQDRDVSDIFVHPEYNYSVYYNDVAVLKLSRTVELTNFVRPCCLWDEDTEIESMIDKQGTVVGWGFDENRKLSNKLMQAKMPIISAVKCIYSNREFFSRFTFEKNYCAGFKNGTSVCNGDSGGGMVFPKKGTSGQNTVWQIRGLVSVGVALQGQGICDTSQYIIFTDVAKHTHWIRQTLSN